MKRVLLYQFLSKKNGWIKPRVLVRTDEEQKVLATLPDISRPSIRLGYGCCCQSTQPFALWPKR